MERQPLHSLEGALRLTHPAGQPLCPPAPCQHPAPQQSSPGAPQCPSPDTWQERQPESKHSVIVKVNKRWRISSRLRAPGSYHAPPPPARLNSQVKGTQGTQLLRAGSPRASLDTESHRPAAPSPSAGPQGDKQPSVILSTRDQVLLNLGGLTSASQHSDTRGLQTHSGRADVNSLCDLA